MKIVLSLVFLFVLAAAQVPPCPSSQEYNECGSACPPTCKDPIPQACIAVCVSGCFCKAGMVKNDLGACVDPKDCSGAGQSGGQGGGGGQGTGGGVKPACIHGGDHVLTPSGLKLVSQLTKLDRVAVGHGRFEPITSFLHRDHTRYTQGYRFTTVTGKTLTLSNEHLVFVAPNNSAVLSKNVKLGQHLYVAKDGAYAEEAVVKIDQSPVAGRYSPLTPSGVLLVNEVLVSCYSQIEDHHLMHKVVNWLLPGTFIERVFGMEESLINSDGMHWLGDSLWHHLRHWFVADRSN